MTLSKYIKCLDCSNLDRDNLQIGLYCKAFPEGIPEEILSGENSHTEPLPKQENKIVFEILSE